jgi:hypothetical protein
MAAASGDASSVSDGDDRARKRDEPPADAAFAPEADLHQTPPSPRPAPPAQRRESGAARPEVEQDGEFGFVAPPARDP